MMKIFKYQLPLIQIQTLNMPKGAIILHAETQHNVPCIWVKVDPDAAKEQRVFQFVGTGNEIPDKSVYIGTVLIDSGAYVFHIFELFGIKRDAIN